MSDKVRSVSGHRVLSPTFCRRYFALSLARSSVGMRRAVRGCNLQRLLPIAVALNIATAAVSDHAFSQSILPNASAKQIILATNRAAIDGVNSATSAMFSEQKRSPNLSYALADVVGARPDGKHIGIRALTTNDLSSVLGHETPTPQPVLLYVHGFANTLESSIDLASRVATMMEFGGPVIVFSWPSQGRESPAGYRGDLLMASDSVDALAELLRELQSLDEVGRIHIIAHSLGNRILLRALVKLEPVISSGRSKLGQTILCSPDVERREFVKDISHGVVGETQATFWASRLDRALLVAPVFGGGEARAGLISQDDDPIVIKGMATIDVSDETSVFALNHNAYMQVDTLFSDISDMLNPNSISPWLNPAKKIHYAEKKNSAGQTYWGYHQ